MRHRLRLTALALAALLAPPAAVADPTGTFFYVIPHGGYTIFDGSLRVGGAPLADGPAFGLDGGYQWKSWLAFEGITGYSPTQQDITGGRDVTLTHFGAGVTLTPYAGRRGGPFVHLGYAASSLELADGPKDNASNIALGGGLRFWMSHRFGLRLNARDLMKFDSGEVTQPLSHNIGFDLGLAITFGATPRDTDGDGVPDDDDRCVNTPAGARVDATGCPLDADGDGVFDGLDGCENTPKGAVIDAKGCPSDADADSVFDGLDQCPGTPAGATVSPTGCPSDADADSVLDGIDQCPDTPQGATVDARGCPSDADGDRVPDGIDKCPDTAAGLEVDSTGCPTAIMKLETEMLDTGMIRVQNINFETAKANLPAAALPVLNNIGQLLTQWPDLKIEIGGHTDSKGSNAANQKLSQARVDSARIYLTRSFPNIVPARLTSKGYGESKPLVPNTSPGNMSKNRRVEFRVLNTEKLRREVQPQKP